MARLNRQRGVEFFRAWRPKVGEAQEGLSFWTLGAKLRKVRPRAGAAWGSWKQAGRWDILRWRQLQQELELEGWRIERVLVQQGRRQRQPACREG